MKPLISKESFIGLDNCTWLFTGAEAPPHQGVRDAMNDYVLARRKGPLGREHNTMIERQCRDNVAQLLHGRREDIAFLSNSSEAISMIAQSLDFKAGDNVVINTLEFPSGVHPWLQLRDKGVDVRIVDHRDWYISVEDVLNKVDERTKLVMMSHVSFISGARFDYRRLYRKLRQTNTLLLLDVTQSLGTMPVHMYEADFVVCSSYKWLMSVHGLGILGINPRRLESLEPKSVGWRGIKELFSPDRFDSFQFRDDARKFERGYPSYPTIYALNFTSKLLLDIGIDRIEQHTTDLSAYLIEQLQTGHYEVMTPTDAVQRGGNISFVCENGEEVADRLAQQKVYVWGGDGRVRVSVHLFNDKEDIDRFLHVLTTDGGNSE